MDARNSDGLEGIDARPQGVHETRMETEAELEKTKRSRRIEGAHVGSNGISWGESCGR